jgi:hypothetical protein
LGVFNTDAQYTYTTNTWRQANSKAGYQVEFVAGLGEDCISASLTGVIDAVSNVALGPQIAIGLDTTSAPTGSPSGWYNASGTGHEFLATAIYSGSPGIGYHFLAGLEKGGDGTGQKFAGANVTGTSNLQAMFVA